ncbi:hypothetical protein [Kitasatospora sp. NPDC058046]|uniref:hypothetical protein n=1 Tax=Kitasatospora sp. NPDC058046 TaxID=3346312 RepID=UPI0036DBB1DC
MTSPALVRYFHGGFPSLKVGDRITPHPPLQHPGCAECAARAAGVQIVMPDGRLSEPPTGRPDRVYISTDKAYARWYASRAVAGDLYRVEPEGDAVRSDEDPFETYICAAAVIVQVVERAVRLMDKDRGRLDRRWKAVEAADRRALLGIPQQLNRR